MDVEVRPVASAAEFRSAMIVNRAAWRDAYAGILPEDTLAGMSVPDGDELQERYDRSTGEGRAFLVAVDRQPGAVVGFAGVVWGGGRKPFCERDDAELRAIYVDPERQRRGIGADLLAAATDRLPGAVGRLVLETFRENDAARGFYETHGFERVGESAFEVDGEAYPTAVYARPV